MPRTEVTTRNNETARRLEAVTGSGEVAGYSQYELDWAGDYTFFHTEVGQAFEGQGIGGQLARDVFDFVRSTGRRIAPTCPFLRGWVANHPEEHDLLVQGFTP